MAFDLGLIKQMLCMSHRLYFKSGDTNMPFRFGKDPSQDFHIMW